MAVVLQILVEVHLHVVAITAQVVAGQVHQHHMLGILLWIIAQVFCSSTVCLSVARPFRRTSNRINKCTESGVLPCNSAVCLWRRAEDAEASEVEIEEVGRGIDAAQGTIEFEVITLVLLDESTREDYLEHVTPQTMLDATTDVCPVLIVCQRTSDVPHGMEVVSLHIRLVHRPDNLID